MTHINRRQFIQNTSLASMGLLINTQVFANDFPTVRVPLEKRNFSSKAIEATIKRMKTSIKDPELAWLFENCFPNTLDTTVIFKEKNGRPDTFVITGDIHAMWLRDSTAQVTPLYSDKKQKESTSNCVKWLLRHKMPSKKLIIGAAFYARVWEYVPDTANGLYQKGHFKRGVPFKNFETYFTEANGFKYHFDEKAQAPYQYSSSQKLFATFDDERSIELKSKYIQEKKLGGMMFWELSEDKPTGGLVDKIHKSLNE